MAATSAAVSGSVGVVIGGGGVASFRSRAAKPAVSLSVQGSFEACRASRAPTTRVWITAVRQADNGRTSFGAGGTEAKLGYPSAARTGSALATAASAAQATTSNSGGFTREENSRSQPFICPALMPSWAGAEGGAWSRGRARPHARRGERHDGCSGPERRRRGRRPARQG